MNLEKLSEHPFLSITSEIIKIFKEVLHSDTLICGLCYQRENGLRFFYQFFLDKMPSPQKHLHFEYTDENSFHAAEEFDLVLCTNDLRDNLKNIMHYKKAEQYMIHFYWSRDPSKILIEQIVPQMSNSISLNLFKQPISIISYDGPHEHQLEFFPVLLPKIQEKKTEQKVRLKITNFHMMIEIDNFRRNVIINPDADSHAIIIEQTIDLSLYNLLFLAPNSFQNSPHKLQLRFDEKQIEVTFKKSYKTIGVNLVIYFPRPLAN